MKYKIYGIDILEDPFVRTISTADLDSMDNLDVLNFISKFWNVRVTYDRAYNEGKEPKIIIASDEHGCLSVFMQTNQGFLRRLSVLLPENHPVYNYNTIMGVMRIQRFQHDSVVGRGINSKYFLRQIEDYK